MKTRLKNKREALLVFIIIVMSIVFTVSLQRDESSPAMTTASTALQECSLVSSGELTPSLERPQDFREASGIIASQRQNIYWMHGDGTQKKPEQSVWAINAEGEFLARHSIPNSVASLVDFEDIALGPGENETSNYLYLAAFGDNDNARDTKTIVRIAEPEVDSSQEYQEAQIPAGGISVLEFRYTTTSGIKNFNAESLFVDPKTSDLYIIAKTLVSYDGIDDVAWVFMVPAESFVTDQVITAKPVAAIKGNHDGSSRNGPTGADIASDGLSIAVLNNNEIIYYNRAPDESIITTLERGPECRISIKSDKNEGITFSKDGTSIIINSESKDTGLDFFEIQP